MYSMNTLRRFCVQEKSVKIRMFRMNSVLAFVYNCSKISSYTYLFLKKLLPK